MLDFVRSILFIMQIVQLSNFLWINITKAKLEWNLYKKSLFFRKAFQ